MVFDQQGPRKDLYRRFNIKTTDSGDDYMAMREVLQRRYTKIADDASWPWLVIIDGGKGQLTQAKKILESFALPGLCVLGIAKGPTRKAGFERLFRVNFESTREQNDGIIEIQKPDDHEILHLLQEIRDEAHRFAIVGHRKSRDKARVKSRLEEIPGVGPKRRSALLKYFGGFEGVARASVDDLARVDGIQKALAQQIYLFLRNEIS